MNYSMRALLLAGIMTGASLYGMEKQTSMEQPKVDQPADEQKAPTNEQILALIQTMGSRLGEFTEDTSKNLQKLMERMQGVEVKLKELQDMQNKPATYSVHPQFVTSSISPTEYMNGVAPAGSVHYSPKPTSAALSTGPLVARPMQANPQPTQASNPLTAQIAATGSVHYSPKPTSAALSTGPLVARPMQANPQPTQASNPLTAQIAATGSVHYSPKPTSAALSTGPLVARPMQANPQPTQASNPLTAQTAATGSVHYSPKPTSAVLPASAFIARPMEATLLPSQTGTSSPAPAAPFSVPLFAQKKEKSAEEMQGRTVIDNLLKRIQELSPEELLKWGHQCVAMSKKCDKSEQWDYQKFLNQASVAFFKYAAKQDSNPEIKKKASFLYALEKEPKSR